MATITFEKQQYKIKEGDSVLTTLLNNGQSLPYGCLSGICQACLMQCEYGKPDAKSQLGLSDYQKQQGFFLPCSSHPKEDLTVSRPPDAARYPTEVLHIEQISPRVLLLRLKSPIPFQPGQNVLIKLGGHTRRYSIASLPPSQSYLEFHIECRPCGAFSNAAQQLNVGDSLSLSSATGECTYRVDSLEQPLLLIAHQTGLAPLLGVLRKALQQGHTGELALVHLAPKGEHYLKAQLQQLMREHAQVSVSLIDYEHSNEALRELQQQLKIDWPELNQHRIYIAGNHDIIQPIAKAVFLQGVNRNQLIVESFQVSR